MYDWQFIGLLGIGGILLLWILHSIEMYKQTKE